MSCGVPLDSQFGPVEQGGNISTVHMSGKHGTGFAVWFVFASSVADADAMSGVVCVGVEAVWVQSCEEFVDSEAGDEGIQLKHCRSVFLHSADVAFFELRAVGGGVGAQEPGRTHLLHRVDMPAEEARTAWL